VRRHTETGKIAPDLSSDGAVEGYALLNQGHQMQSQ